MASRVIETPVDVAQLRDELEAEFPGVTVLPLSASEGRPVMYVGPIDGGRTLVITPAQVPDVAEARLDAVIAAHDPAATGPAGSISFLKGLLDQADTAITRLNQIESAAPFATANLTNLNLLQDAVQDIARYVEALIKSQRVVIRRVDE